MSRHRKAKTTWIYAKAACRSRNLRLTAIRSFFRYAALECPEYSEGIQRVLAIPRKRQSSRLVDFLTKPETPGHRCTAQTRSTAARVHQVRKGSIHVPTRIGEFTVKSIPNPLKIFKESFKESLPSILASIALLLPKKRRTQLALGPRQCDSVMNAVLRGVFDLTFC